MAGLVVFTVAGLAYLRSRPYSGGVSATAVVIDHVTVDVQGTPNYRPVVEFDVDGARYQVEAVIAESERLAEGGDVEISYRPGNPESARVKAPGVQVMRASAIAGAVAAAVGIASLSPPLTRRLNRLQTNETIEGKESDEI